MTIQTMGYARLLTTLLIAGLCGCGIGGQLATERQPGLPSLPAQDDKFTPARHVSSTYQLDVQAPVGQGGNTTRSDAGRLVIAGNTELPWAMYGVSLTDAQRPLSIDLSVGPAPVQTGGIAEPMHYFVGASDYSGLTWEWTGPYAANATIVLNSASATRNPRRTSPSDMLYFVVVAGSVNGAPVTPAALAIEELTVNTTNSFQPTLPGALFPTANQGNNRTPGTPYDTYTVSVHWQHVAALSPLDDVNIADSYNVYRRAPGGEFVQIGSLPAPQELYIDPLDNSVGISSPLPNTEYDYYVLATNAQGSSGRSGYASVTTGNLTVGSQWTTHRGNNARTGYNPGMAINGLLTPKWEVQTQIGTQLNRYEPVLTEDNQILVAAGSEPRQYGLNDGAQADAWPGFTPLTGYNLPTVFGHWLTFPAKVDGLNLLDLPGKTVTHLESAGPVWGAPLFIDGDVVFADKSGVVMRYNAFTAEPVWQFNAAPASPFSLSPAASATHIYAADEVGRVFKIDAATGEQVDSVNLSAEPLGDSVALDVDRNLLWLATDESCLVAISTLDMTVINSWPDVPVLKQAVAPCIVGNVDPPVVVVAYSLDTASTNILAVNPDTMLETWSDEFNAYPAYSVTACADAILLLKDNSEGGGGSELLQFSLAGAYVERQEVDHTGAGSAIPIEGQIVVPSRNDPYLQCFESAAVTRPLWQDEDTGGIGIQNFECASENDKDDMRISWYNAYHPEGLIVKYVLFYSAGQPPMLDAPYTDTTVVAGLTASENNSTLLFDLPLGIRYYATIRAYVGTWGVDAVTDLNTNWIASTPPWQERVVYTSGSALPSESISTFALAAAPSDGAYLVSAEAANGKLWNFWRTSLWGGYDFEGDALNTYSADAAAASWHNNLYAARAGSGTLSILKRNSKNDWAPEAILSGANPDSSPAVALIMGSQSGVAYTELVGGTEPTSEVDYYAVRHNGSAWGSPEVVESDNAGGSDLDVALDPSDPAKLWVAYQKGTSAATGLPTCLSGELWFARGDGSGGYTHELVDAGSNGPASDCGKRVRLVLEGSTPHLAYFDLNAAGSEPRGALKYAYHDGASWQVSTVTTFDTSDQLGEYRATYSELGLTLLPTGPAIAMLKREQFNALPDVFTIAAAHVYLKNGAGWSHEIVSDPKPVLTKDREPCDMISTTPGYLDLFFVAPHWQSTLDPGRQIVFLRRF